MKRSRTVPAAAAPLRRAAPVRIGFIALTDCAPLLVAESLGMFTKHDVSMELHREVGWATIREKILYRQLEATHAIAGLALPLRLGMNGLSCPAIVPFVFSLNGNVITLSMDLWRRGVRDAASFAKLIRSTPQRLFTLGIVARASSHNFLMRRWLRSGGIDPDRDVRLVVLPPTQMAGPLKAGLIDGFCVSDPWNSLAVAQGFGWCPALSEDLMPGHIDKVLVTTEPFADERPEELRAVVRALYEACAFCDVSENRGEVVEILHRSGHLRVDKNILRMALTGPFDDGMKQRRGVESFYIFHRDEANAPSAARAQWVFNEFLTHNLLPGDLRARAAEEIQKCYREDLYAAALGHPARPVSKPAAKTKSRPVPALT